MNDQNTQVSGQAEEVETLGGKTPDELIPDPNQMPAVAEARANVDRVTGQLAGVRAERVALEAKLGIGAKGDDDVAAEAKLLAEGDVEGLSALRRQRRKLAELRRNEHLFEEAVKHASGTLAGALAVAQRVCKKAAYENVVLPLARQAAAAWLVLAGQVENRFRRLIGRLDDIGIGPGDTYVPFASSMHVPMNCGDPAGLIEFCRGLIQVGVATREQINETFPNLL